MSVEFIPPPCVLQVKSRLAVINEAKSLLQDFQPYVAYYGSAHASK